MNRVVVLALVLLGLASAPAALAESPAAALKLRGDNLLAQGAPDKAVEAYKQAIKVDPSYQDAYSALAAHYLRAQAYASAVTVLRQVLSRSPDFEEGWYNLAYALRKQGKLDAAIGAYRRFAQLRPTSADPYYGIGLALQAKGDVAGAARAFRRYVALEKNPGKTVWVDKARKLAERLEKSAGIQPAPTVATKPAPTVTAKAPPAKPKAPPAVESGDTLSPQSSHHEDSAPVTPQRERAMRWKAAGDQLARSGRLADAADRYRRAVKEDYSYTAAYNELGTVLFGLKRYEEAIRAFRIALRDNPDYHLGWYNLGYALRKTGRLLPAIAAYNKFIQVRPRDPDPYFGLALAQKAAGNNQEAIKAFKRYVELERRPAQEKWVYKAKVEVALLEGRPPPEYKPGQEIVAAVAPSPKPLSAKEQRRLAREERKRALLEKKRLAAEARKAKREAARLAQKERAGKKRPAADTHEETGSAAAVPVVPALPSTGAAGALAGVQPAPDVIVSPAMPRTPRSAGSTQSDRFRVQGDTLARTGKLQQAASAYHRAIKIDPFNTRAYDGMAYVAFKLGAYVQGARRLSIGIRDNPSYTGGWLHQARLYRAANEDVKAVGSYRKYVQQAPDDIAARLELARTLRKLGIKDQAVAEYRACLRAKVAGNEPYVVAARDELGGLGVTPPPLRGAVAAAPVPAVSVPRPGESKAEARKRALEEKRRAQREAREAKKRELAEKRRARREAREAKRRELAEKRRLAAEARKAKIEAAKLARDERRRALQEKRRAEREAREAKKRELAEKRRARRARRRGRRGAGAALAEAVAEDMAEAAPPVPPRTRMHDVLRPAPDAAAGLMRVADDQFAKKRYVVSLGIYQQAARLDPGSSEPLYKAGVAAVALGQMHLAADLFTRVLKIDPANATARVNLQMAEAAARSTKPPADYLATAGAEARQALAEGRYAEAEQQTSRLLRQSSSAETYLLRSEARLALRKPRQALVDGGRALALDPGAAAAFRVLGDAHRQLGHADKAAYYYRIYLSRAGGAADRAQIEQLLKELKSE